QEALARIDHAPSRAAVTAERDALARAEGGCDVAFGAYCFAAGGQHELTAMHERAGAVRVARVRGTEASQLGAAAWAELVAAHGRKS
ncbi:MAG TPA: hydroxymethylbilane synthase, partial [Gammaproteobacteria bacterium]|nr:hydroxymethylbilane synthase [Gammaproteobacteria bacterium]